MDSTTTVSLRDIAPNPWNPHRMLPEELDALKQSILEDGQWRPILVIEMDVPDDETPVIKAPYRIIDGEHLYKALNALGYSEAQVMVYGKNSEVPTWKQKEIGQVINHGLRGSVEDPVKTQAIYQELVRYRPEEVLARRVGLGVTGIKSFVEPTEVKREARPVPLGVRSTPYQERKTSTVALVFETAAEQKKFEDLVDAVGGELIDPEPYAGRRGQYRIAVLQKALQLAGESVGVL